MENQVGPAVGRSLAVRSPTPTQSCDAGIRPGLLLQALLRV